MLSRARALREAVRDEVTPATRAVVMERSWLSSRHCFAVNSRELGHLDALEDSIHSDIFRWGLDTWPVIDGARAL